MPARLHDPEEQARLVGWLFSDESDEDDDDDEAVEPDELSLDDFDLSLLEVDVDLEDEDIDGGDMITLGDVGYRDSEWTDTPGQRDERAADYSSTSPHGEVRSYLRKTGLAETIRDGLAEAAAEEEERPVSEGDLLDMRNVIRRLAGDTTVEDYYRGRRERPGDDVAVGVSVDNSGSMSGDERDVKAAVGGFLHGVQMLGGDVVANAWHDPRTVQIRLVTGPYEEFRWNHLDSFQPKGGDPIARGMWECAMMLEQTTAAEKLLVVITDGNPTVRSRESLRGQASDAQEEAQLTADELRDRGMEVIGLGFGRVREAALEEMFGAEYSEYVPLDELADALVDQFERLYDHQQLAV